MRAAIPDIVQRRRLELTVQELTAIEQILARFSVAEIAIQLERTDPALGPLLASVLRKIGVATHSADEGEGFRPAWMGGTFDHRYGVTLHEPSQTITILGDQFVCKPTSFRVLSCLIENVGQWVRADALARDALNTCFQKGASNVRWHVLQARRALGGRGSLVHSDNRLGYMFDLGSCNRKHCKITP